MELLGVRVPGPLSTVGAIAGTVRGVLGGRQRRQVWSCPGRLHVEAHGVHGAGGERVARRIERELEKHEGVHWARVNAPSSRVIIAVDDPAPRTEDLVRVVERAEAEPDTEQELVAEDELHHPADGVRGTRLLPTLAANAIGLGLSAITRVAPWAPLPAELAALPSVLDLHPKLRELAAKRAGSGERADTATSIAAALGHGLAAGGEGTLLDTVQRVEQWREARAYSKAWCAAESSLITGPEDAAADPVVVERPRPLPDGPVEDYERKVLAAGAAATAVMLPFGPRRALGIGLASLPKAAEAGRAAFGAHLGRVLARHGTLVMDRAVLRRLDTVDMVVVDEGALDTGRMAPSELKALSDEAGLVDRVWQLFDPKRPRKKRSADGWRLAPLDEPGEDGEELLRKGAAAVLGLWREDELHALLGLKRETPPGIATLVAAARRANLPIVSANGDEPSFDADRTVPGGKRLVASVRDLQAEGHVVLLVSADRQALGASDCGVGVHADGEAPPWGAHLLVGDDLAVAGLLIEATCVARDIDRDGIRLAAGASGVGAVSALQRGRTSPASRSLRAVNAGAGLAIANAHRRAGRLRPPALNGAVAPWHLMPADIVLERLKTDHNGLSTQEVRRRTRASGGEEKTSFANAFIAELSNPLTPVLLGGAALSASVGSPSDALLVAGVTALSAVVGSVQQVRTERQLAELLHRSATTATVLRDGEERTLAADELVRGDVVLLDSGDVVPADCRLLTSEALEMDESSLTGESLPIAKNPAPVVAADVADRTSILYEGTTVAAGQATAVVIATGDDTEAGRSMALAREGAPDTGVENRLAELTRKSMPAALGSAVAVAGAGLVRGIPLRESMSAAVNLAVASVPEGLPFLVNAAQLAAARRLAEHNALVRNPRSIEALGRVDVLCFDKTGTLTEGKLTVHEIDDGQDRRVVDNLTSELSDVLAVAVRATPHADNPTDLPHATDRAVLSSAEYAGERSWEQLDAVPFEPSRGYHATLCRLDGETVLSVKGAPEAVLPKCSLDEATHRRLSKRMKKLTQAGQRVLAVAERSLDSSTVDEDAVEDLEFRGFVAIADPVRGSAASAAAQLREAGVQIVMITGDHPDTGEAIASEVMVDKDQLHVVTGAQIEELDEDRLAETLRTVDVVARCSPVQKVRIIKAYQRLGRTVAMTGDGANDAPAIRLADVGIALGEHGTPAAKAAADLVVTDDRLETIIAALIEGRAMWASVREALAILLGGNLGEIAFSVLGAVLTGRSPLTARQLLLVNLLTDLAPALAIALRRPSGGTELLSEGPESSLGKALQRDIGVRAGVTTLGATTAWTLARVTGRGRRASTVALASLVGTQLGQTLVTGGVDRPTLAASLGSAAALALVIQTPGVSRFFGCTPLGPVGWTIALGSATSATLLGTLFDRQPEEAD
ncbi:calcium-translocating P-type ATPase [Amycolatopsis bartoniae]|uniref:Putative cation-transporting ATPase I n=1 Tax=Amycolatopsis bartoniae TaxID=941986 RepID=A0A8H9IQ82_9PSEU|nr:HAD-IC family P-type ATPase [Amycolatopsis bartoniae]MBB2934484.1 calcium-translocating P-type ATPase [Amycolatopsis bartoniae]TVT01866.1 HAD-IC family P-type ATPase [Amycolatopsis bartoniae]GHF47064.1 putative cation-transporting ATPase I [Amycolatopsis bartoniae]